MILSKDTIFRSQTYGEVALKDIPEKLKLFYDKNKHYGTPFNIIIGTDSQNHQKTKIVSVIAITCEGRGGIFFSCANYVDRINSVKEKLNHETGNSLVIATELIDIFENTDGLEEVYLEVPISIHIDAGNSPRGKTFSLIKDLVGWVSSTGFECKIKPDSFAASSIADKISK